MLVEVKVPEAGESISEGVLIEWFKSDGAIVAPDEALFEVETDKITLRVEAEAAGKLSIAAEAGSTVEIGQVVATIDTSVAPVEVSQNAVDVPPAAAAPQAPPDSKAAASPKGQAGAPVAAAAIPLSPAVRRLVQEHGVDPSALEGSGKGGRLIKGDVLTALRAGDVAQKQPASVTPPVSLSERSTGAVTPAEVGRSTESPRETRTPMSSLRRRVAERLVQVQQTAAILTTFNEVDMSALLALRARHKESFTRRHEVKLGMMSFFVQAVVDALRAVPAVNARIEGDEIVRNHFYDIGVAVGTSRGLVVPVLRDADRMSLAQIELAIADLAQRADAGRLELKELQGGCFTISNGGVYGSLLSTPILNPPQSGILGMHGIKKRPIVVGPDDRIEARPMMYLALSYDHRLVDGKEAVTFLRRVVELIEQPERLLLQA